VIGGLATVLTVIGGAVTMRLQPIDSGLERHEHEIRAISEELNKSVQKIVDHTVAVGRYDRDHDEQERWTTSLRDRIRFNEDRGVFKDDLARVDKALEKLGDSSASKSDLEEAVRRSDERINTMGAALHDLQREVYSRPLSTGVRPAD
jgi:hypothetical protein